MSIILMVAISVVLAAVIGTMALGMGEKVSKSAPQATFEVHREEDTFGSATCGVVFITHKYGDKVDAENLHVTVNGKQAWDIAWNDGSGRTVRPTANIDTLMSGTKLRVVYWENDYHEFPIGKNKLITAQQGLGGGETRHVLKPSSGSDTELENDMLSKGDRIKLIYEFPESGQTVTLDTLTVDTGQLNEFRCY